MDDREFDLAGLRLVRDEVLAIHQGRTLRWQAAQVAALAMMSIALLGYVNRTLNGGEFSALVVLGLLIIWLAAVVLAKYDREVARELRILRAQVESLKGRTRPLA